MTSNGDAANKIGTYLKALAARDNGIPFHIAHPLFHDRLDHRRRAERSRSRSGTRREVLSMAGRTEAGEVIMVDIAAPGSPAANPAFDVTPARLITSLITERGVCPASAQGLLALYPEKADEQAA